MDIDDPLVSEVAAFPDPFEEGPAAEHPAGGGGQLAEQPELGEREVDLLAAAADHAGADVEDERAAFGVENEGGLLGGRATGGRHGDAGAASQRSQPRTDLLDLKRFRDVVVRTRLECGNDVVGVGLGAEHDDRRLAVRPHLADEREPVHATEHEIDEHEVGWVALDDLEGGLRAGRLGDVVALVLHGEAQGGPNAVVVLEDQELQ
jgi:hypothetical protein